MGLKIPSCPNPGEECQPFTVTGNTNSFSSAVNMPTVQDTIQTKTFAGVISSDIVQCKRCGDFYRVVDSLGSKIYTRTEDPSYTPPTEFDPGEV